jgi:hypothetical protein
MSNQSSSFVTEFVEEHTQCSFDAPGPAQTRRLATPATCRRIRSNLHHNRIRRVDVPNPFSHRTHKPARRLSHRVVLHPDLLLVFRVFGQHENLETDRVQPVHPLPKSSTDRAEERHMCGGLSPSRGCERGRVHCEVVGRRAGGSPRALVRPTRSRRLRASGVRRTPGG